MQQFRLSRYRGKWCVIWHDPDAGTKRHSLGLDGSEENRQAAEISFNDFLAVQRRELGKPAGLVTVDRCLSGYFDSHPKVYPRPALLAFFSNKLLSHIDQPLCEEYARRRAKAGKRPATIKDELGILSTSLRWAKKAGWLPEKQELPIVWRPEGSPPRDRWLTPEEYNRLVTAACAPHIALFIKIAIYTAARAGAILDLAWSQVSFDLKRIDLNQPGRQQTAKRRPVVPILPELAEVLLEARKAALTDYVIEYGGERVTSVKHGFANTATRAGLEGVTPHTLRHTAATWMAQSGAPMWEIAGMLGHSSSEITERVYATHHPDYLDTAASAIGDRLRSSPPVQMNRSTVNRSGTRPKNSGK